MKRDSLFVRYSHDRRPFGGAKAAEPLVLWAWSRYPETVIDPAQLYVRVLQKALGREDDVRAPHLFRSLCISMALTPVPTPDEVRDAVAAISKRGITQEEWDEYRRDEDAGKPELGPEHFPKRMVRGKRKKGRVLSIDWDELKEPDLPSAA